MTRRHSITLIKGSERYVFIFTWENRSEIFRVFGRYASNPEYDFNWYDAARLAQAVRKMKKGRFEI